MKYLLAALVLLAAPASGQTRINPAAIACEDLAVSTFVTYDRAVHGTKHLGALEVVQEEDWPYLMTLAVNDVKKTGRRDQKVNAEAALRFLEAYGKSCD